MTIGWLGRWNTLLIPTGNRYFSGEAIGRQVCRGVLVTGARTKISGGVVTGADATGNWLTGSSGLPRGGWAGGGGVVTPCANNSASLMPFSVPASRSNRRRSSAVGILRAAEPVKAEVKEKLRRLLKA
jgi:hypothetical protein